MKIKRAIELLEKIQMDDLPLPRHQEWEAVMLSIEALKRINEERTYHFSQGLIGINRLLPGETEEGLDMQTLLPACREERVIELLEDFAANRDEYSIRAVAAEHKHLVAEQLAEERRMESTAR